MVLWSTFAPIVQECRVLLFFFLSPTLAWSFSVLSSSFAFLCYITPISLHRSVSPYLVVSIFKMRYSLDRYASRLSLFCLSNTYSTASCNVGENRAFVMQLQLRPQRRDDLSRLLSRANRLLCLHFRLFYLSYDIPLICIIFSFILIISIF